MAIDPARIRKRAIEAELSGRPPLSVGQAEQALRVLAVVVDEEVREQPEGVAAALHQAC